MHWACPVDRGEPEVMVRPRHVVLGARTAKAKISHRLFTRAPLGATIASPGV